MSASEKLKALEERRPEGWARSDTVTGSLIYALPQIRAVVEAAEESLRIMDATPLATALAALDEALQ